MGKPNIKQILQDKPKKIMSLGNDGQIKKAPSKDSGKASLLDSPLFMMAKLALDNITPKQKYMIGGVLYFILMGVVGTIYLLIKLILLFF